MKIRHNFIPDPITSGLGNGQTDANPDASSGTAEEHPKHKHLRRFTQNPANRTRRRRRAHDAESMEQHNHTEEQLILNEAAEERRKRPNLMITPKFEMDQGGAQQQTGNELNQKKPHPNLLNLRQEEAQKEINKIVRSYLEQHLAQTNDPKNVNASLSAVAHSLISLRDTKANHSVDVPLTHAILSIVRQYIANDHSTANTPTTLAQVKELLVAIAPQGVPEASLRNYHLKIPLILLNLRKPRKQSQRISAFSTLSSLMNGMTTNR